MNKTLVLTKEQIEQKLQRMTWEVYEKNYQEKTIVIAGIAKRGYVLAERMAKILENISPIEVKLVKVELNKDNPFSSDIKVTEGKYENAVIILVDDVLKSGKTLIHGAQHFLQTPLKKLMTAVLIDRNYKRYPITADVVGLSLSTTLQEHVAVELGDNEAVYLL